MKKLCGILFVLFLCLTLCACDDPCEHTFKIQETEAATCEENGSIRLQCSSCGISFTEEMPATGHRFADANCVAAQRCVLCGVTQGDASGHDWKEASCTNPKSCKTCGLEEGDALGHDFTAATCTEAKNCSACGKIEGEPHGHEWAEATCTAPKTCNICAATEGEKTEHSFLEATCSAVKTCVDCGTTEGEPLDHDWADATCTEAKACTRCGVTEGDPLDHSWADATCTTPQVCLTCGTIVGEALEHSYQSSNIKSPTCCEKGQREYVCRRCVHTYIEEYEAKEYTAVQIYDKYKETVGEIITYDEYENEIGIGTCIVYTSEGYLVTNYHVIEGAYSAKVRIGEQIYTVQNVLAFDRFIDIAIVQIHATGLKPAVWCEGNHVAGKTVYAIGSSYGLTLSLSQGIISYASREINGVKYVQHNAPISEGNSGGPLINEYGEVIGINTMSLLDAQNLNFAIHASELSRITWTKMTMQEFYNYTKENDPFVKMKNFIVAKGEYDKENKCYQMLCNYTISIANQNYAYRTDRIACYFEEEDVIALSAAIIDTNGEQYYLAMIISPEVTGVYEWSYYDTFERTMAGVLEAGVFAKSSVLEYAFNDIEKDNTRNNTRNLVTRLTRELLEAFNSKFKEVGMTVKDLGFLKY